MTPQSTVYRKPKKKLTKVLWVPPIHDWRSSDQDEINRRILRAREEKPRIRNLTPEHPIFSTFEVLSPSGMRYEVEIRDLAQRQFFCTCTDFRINGLGTCKHTEAVLLRLRHAGKGSWKLALQAGSRRIDIVPVRESILLRVERNLPRLPKKFRSFFDVDGLQQTPLSPRELHSALESAALPDLRLSLEIEPWLQALAQAEERSQLRRSYELGVQSGQHPSHETLTPLFPYQREGMLHLAFGERSLLADEMGLGKTIQAIAACALLHRLGKAHRALIVTPASLKTEWEEQIRRFTTLPLRLIFGGRAARTQLYADPKPPFFTIVNYEQVIPDSLDLNHHLQPDIIVLDEAQRIKNWSTKIAQAVKRLKSRYAFVLTGTPIENRIDELRSIIDFLNPEILGPLFRFNREYYVLDEKGRAKDYQNLGKLRECVRPLLLRRRKADVETELPDRIDRNLFVPLTPSMRDEYSGYEKQVAELVQIAQRRPLAPKEQDLLMVLMNMLRMICDSPSIIKNNPNTDCPKLTELARVAEEALSDPEVKIIIFSEWEGMLRKVKDWAENENIGYAWHTGTVPQKRRRAEILAFRNDPDCRLFLSTDSGGVGLNLQIASVVINCDLPWNPAKLEQRIARAWRKNQRRAVTVINLIAEKTLEHGMLASLANKMELAQGVLDGTGDLDQIKLKGGGQSFLKRLEQIMLKVQPNQPASAVPSTSDPAAAFASRLRDRFGPHLERCEESFPPDSNVPVLVAVLREPVANHRPVLEEMFHATDWHGEKPVLQLLDIATWDAIQQLAAAGMISIHTRATRHLLQAEGEVLPPLTQKQLARINELRAISAKKRRAAKALTAEDLPEEASLLIQAAEKTEAEALAIENRRPEPAP